MIKRHSFLSLFIYSILSITIFLDLIGCGSSKSHIPPTEEAAIEIDSTFVSDTTAAAKQTSYRIVNLFYGTDRNFTESSKPSELFGGERSNIGYGFCNISIPKNHILGELESPSAWRFQFKENPEKHVVLIEVNRYDKDAFFSTLNSTVEFARDRRAFVFIHGYNVTFNDAARRVAQMAFDLQFKGTPILYSWPSKGKELQYPADESNIEWTESHLESFLMDIATRSKFETVFLIAHSMGNRALTKVLTRILSRPEADIFKEIILIAPDVDADIFKQKIAPELVSSGKRITLYASSEDKALQVSKKLHSYARAGDSGDGLVVMKGIETIDATNLKSGFVGHSYYAESRAIISDLYYLFKDGQSAEERFALKAVDSENGRYWVFKK